jgi:hypothetical protein
MKFEFEGRGIAAAFSSSRKLGSQKNETEQFLSFSSAAIYWPRFFLQRDAAPNYRK